METNGRQVQNHGEASGRQVPGLGRMNLHLCLTCLPHLSPTVGALGRTFLRLSPTLVSHSWCPGPHDFIEHLEWNANPGTKAKSCGLGMQLFERSKSPIQVSPFGEKLQSFVFCQSYGLFVQFFFEMKTKIFPGFTKDTAFFFCAKNTFFSHQKSKFSGFLFGSKLLVREHI